MVLRGLIERPKIGRLKILYQRKERNSSLVNCTHAQERVVDTMWRMVHARSLARGLVDSGKLFFDSRLLSAFDSFWRAINERNGDLCC